MAIKKHLVTFTVEAYAHSGAVGIGGLDARLRSALAETMDKGLILFDFDTLRLEITTEAKS